MVKLEARPSGAWTCLYLFCLGLFPCCQDTLSGKPLWSPGGTRLPHSQSLGSPVTGDRVTSSGAMFQPKDTGPLSRPSGWPLVRAL